MIQLTPYDIECLSRAKSFIDADMAKHHTIAEIAAHAVINTTKLKAGFRQRYGTGLYHYLKERRMSYGKYMLENTSRPLKEISNAAGYKHTCNFITAFKKRYGISPRSWRSQLLVWITIVQYLPDYF